MNHNIPTDNKQLRLYNKDNKFQRVSVDEAIASGKNKWKNWHCSAGARSLYVDYDGNVWRANCFSSRKYGEIHSARVNKFSNEDQAGSDDRWKEYRESVIGEYPHKQWVINNVGPEHWPMPKENWENSPAHVALMQEIGRLEQQFFTRDIRDNPLYKQFLNTESWIWKSKKEDNVDGLLGSIFNGWEVPTSWIRCPFSSCGCGADVILSKAKDRESIELLGVTIHGHKGQHLSSGGLDDVGETIAVEMSFPITHQILWDITRRCNYDCNYCWPSIHNNSELFHEADKIYQFIDQAIEDWSENDTIRWNFGGGEPTMHPEFVNILQYLNSKSQWILLTTNGSRSTSYFEKIIPYLNSINMSAHFGSMDRFPGHVDRFKNNCKQIINYHKNNDGDHWLEVKLMTPPGFLDRALSFKQEILSYGIHDTGANNRQIGEISLVPIRDLNNSSELVGYTHNEISFFQQQ